MNNNITEDYCSFEVSKLLKEKGFNVPCFSYYQLNKKFRFFKREQDIITNWYEKEEYEINYEGENDFKEAKVEKLAGTSRPTYALAIKWIRENFGIHIYNEISSNNTYRPKAYELVENKFGIWEGFKYEKPEEATEAALLYILKNLIS